MRGKFKSLMTDLKEKNKNDKKEKKLKESGHRRESKLINLNFDEPFLMYGPGLHNFLMTNDRLICVFILFAALALIQMIVFRSFDGVQGITGFGITTDWSFGGIGFPTNECSKFMIDWYNESRTINMHF